MNGLTTDTPQAIREDLHVGKKPTKRLFKGIPKKKKKKETK